MKIVVFRLTMSSSWGNGHATLWRALCSALAARGHTVVFLERDLPYYAATRDMVSLPAGELILYSSLADVAATAAIDVKSRAARSSWVWGAFKMPGYLLHELHALWRQPERGDEYLGTLVNAYLAAGGHARAVRAGESYVDVGTLHGYREAMRLLHERATSSMPIPLHMPQPGSSERTDFLDSAGGELHDADIARIA